MSNPTSELDGRSFLAPAFSPDGQAHGYAISYPPDLAAAFPSGVPIRQVILADQSSGPPPNQSSLWTLDFDRGGRYVANSGWPTTQNGSFYPLFGLAGLNLGPGLSMFSEPKTFDPPVMWRPGDLLLLDFSASGGPTADFAVDILFEVPFGQYVLGPFNTQWNGQPEPGPPPGSPVAALGKSQSVSGSQISLTTTAAAPAGSTIVVAAISNANYSEPTASDGVNAYSVVHNFNGAMLFLESAPLAAALPAGSVITINSGGPAITDGWIAAAAVTGLTPSTADGVNTAPTTTVSTGTLPSAPQVVFGLAMAYNSAGEPGAITQTTGFTSIANETNFGPFSVDFDYFLASTTTPPAYSWEASITNGDSMVMALPGN